MEAINHFLVKIPGPFFLLYYTIWAIALFIFYKVIYLRYVSGRNAESYVKPQLSAIELVVLNNMGSKINMIKAIITSLWYKKILVLRDDGTMHLQRESAGQPISRAEQTVGAFFKEPQSLQKVFLKKDLIKQFSNDLEEIYESLRAKQLLKQPVQHRTEKLVYFVVLFLLIFPAVLKFRLGLMHNKPVVFLMTLLIIFFVIFLAIFPTKKTRYVKTTIKDYQEKYKNVKADISKSQPYNNSIDPLLYAGIFGVSALFLFPEFGALNSVFPAVSSSSGCSSCSTSSGCSSCGGGGGGGGCGGCGGGD